MDNFTQGVVGGALYTLVTGKKSNKQFRLGACIANIPDLDVVVGKLLPLSHMDKLFFHRGIMHSIVFNIVVSLGLGYVLYRSDRTVPYRKYAVGSFISILFGHLLIDGMTSYGMRYWLPFSGKTVSSDNIFVVDFGMWIVTIVGLVWYMLGQAKTKIARGILIAVGIYFFATFVMQGYVTQVFEDHYPQRGVPIKVIDAHTLAEPLQPLLRRHLIKTSRGYYEGYYSILDTNQHIKRKRTATNKSGQQTIEQLAQQDSVVGKDIRHIISFARGQYRVIPITSGYQIDSMIFGPINGWQDTSTRMFSFQVLEDVDGYHVTTNRDNTRAVSGKVWSDFWNRVAGI